VDDLDIYERASCVSLIEVVRIYYILPLTVAQKVYIACFPKPRFKLEGYWLMSCNCDIKNDFPLAHKSV
jgi:hypothetical protein